MELDSVRPDIERFEAAKKEHDESAALQEREGERQRLAGKAAGLDDDIRRLRSRESELAGSDETASRLAKSLEETERAMADSEQEIRFLREERIAQEQSIQAQIKHLEQAKAEVEARKVKIAEAGAECKCPTCERPLATEPAHGPGEFRCADCRGFRSDRRARKLRAGTQARRREAGCRLKRAGTILRPESTLSEKKKRPPTASRPRPRSVSGNLAARQAELHAARAEIAKLPAGFDQARFTQLRQIGIQLQPVYKKSVQLSTALGRLPIVEAEIGELTGQAQSKSAEISGAERAISELNFDAQVHQSLPPTSKSHRQARAPPRSSWSARGARSTPRLSYWSRSIGRSGNTIQSRKSWRQSARSGRIW